MNIIPENGTHGATNGRPPEPPASIDQYFRDAISKNNIPRPPICPDDRIREAAESVFLANQRGGYEAGYVAWHETISPDLRLDYPAIVDAVNNPPPLCHIDELGETRMRWLIDREIPTDGLTVMFGPSGTYKSFRALDYAHRIAQEGNVIYIAAEGAAGYGKRAKAWKQHHRQQSGGLYIWRNAVSMLYAEYVEQFIIQVQHLRPRLVIIDTLARCMLGGDENSAKDMGLFIAACNTIQQRLNTAVLVVHHTGKTGTSERGSSALRGAADSMIEISADDGVIKVSCSKTKDESPFDTYYLKPVQVQLPNGDSSLVLLPSERVLEDTEALSENQRTVIEWLASPKVFDQGARSNDLMTATNIAKGSFFRVIQSLARRDLITKDGKYDPWILTDQGKEIARRHNLCK